MQRYYVTASTKNKVDLGKLRADQVHDRLTIKTTDLEKSNGISHLNPSFTN